MFTLKNYIQEQERAADAPVTGDEFDFHVNETLSIETSVLAHDNESFTIELDEHAYTWLEEMGMYEDETVEQTIAEDTNHYNYAVEYHMAGSDDAATKAIRIVPVKITSGPMYPEYVRKQIEDSPVHIQMKEKGYRPGKTRGVWQGNIDSEITLAKDKLSQNLTDEFRNEFTKKVEDLEFVKRHMDGKPYKTSFGRETSEDVEEAKYQGREVKLGKPMSGDVRKYKVYVKNPKTGNIKKVNFGDPNMQIKRDDPARRKSFRARHGCGTPRASDRTKAAYWSCRMWSSKPVSQILKGK